MNASSCVWLLGETGPQFQDIFSCVQVVETMQEALDAAVANSKEQDIVLLSPACSSYDQFPNYEVRGALFKEMVMKVAAGIGLKKELMHTP